MLFALSASAAADTAAVAKMFLDGMDDAKFITILSDDVCGSITGGAASLGIPTLVCGKDTFATHLLSSDPLRKIVPGTFAVSGPNLEFDLGWTRRAGPNLGLPVCMHVVLTVSGNFISKMDLKYTGERCASGMSPHGETSAISSVTSHSVAGVIGIVLGAAIGFAAAASRVTRALM